MTPEAQVRLAELDESICWVIDLHDEHLQFDPTRHVEQGLKDTRKAGKDVLKIIHGRGAGVLQDKIRRWLERERRKGAIAYFRASDRLEEIGGVLYVVLQDLLAKRNSKS